MTIKGIGRRARSGFIFRQTLDEGLIIKLFDSAALGEVEQAAGASCHGSPALMVRG